MIEKPIYRIAFYASINDSDPFSTGFADVYEDDLEGRDIEDFLINAGSDWAYEAVHTDNLRYWAELINE